MDLIGGYFGVLSASLLIEQANNIYNWTGNRIIESQRKLDKLNNGSTQSKHRGI